MAGEGGGRADDGGGSGGLCDRRGELGTELVMDAFSVRKEAKGHGTGRVIEGSFSPGDEVVVVEDVITTGGSAQRAIGGVGGRRAGARRAGGGGWGRGAGECWRGRGGEWWRWWGLGSWGWGEVGGGGELRAPRGAFFVWGIEGSGVVAKRALGVAKGALLGAVGEVTLVDRHQTPRACVRSVVLRRTTSLGDVCCE